MDEKEIAFRKMSLSLEAYNQMLQQEQQEAMEDEDDFEEYRDELMDALKDAAFQVLIDNPGSDLCDWRKTLIEEYGPEVTDALGNNPPEVFEMLDDIWGSPYLDKCSGLEYDFNEWAEAFATDASVRMYYDLAAK